MEIPRLTIFVLFDTPSFSAQDPISKFWSKIIFQVCFKVVNKHYEKTGIFESSIVSFFEYVWRPILRI